MPRVEQDGPVWIITLDRPARRNAIDRATADALFQAFSAFDADPGASVAVLCGDGSDFCAGADLQAIAAGDPNRVLPVEPGNPGPLGPTRLVLDKPVIAAIEGHAVAGGLELAAWADLRVAGETATFGVYCRRYGVPLIDGGTARLPALIGLSRAMDLVLTGRAVPASEALAIGLVNRVVPAGQARAAAIALAHEIAAFPQACLRADRRAARRGTPLGLEDALRFEYEQGLAVLGDAQAGAGRFVAGAR